MPSDSQSVEVLLRWGSLTNYNPESPEFDPLHEAAYHGDIRSMKLVVEYQPQFLHEEWLLKGEIPHALTDTEEGAEFVDTLQKIRRTQFVLICCAELQSYNSLVPILSQKFRN